MEHEHTCTCINKGMVLCDMYPVFRYEAVAIQQQRRERRMMDRLSSWNRNYIERVLFTPLSRTISQRCLRKSSSVMAATSLTEACWERDVFFQHLRLHLSNCWNRVMWLHLCSTVSVYMRFKHPALLNYTYM